MTALARMCLTTLRDLAPVLGVLAFFQLVVLGEPPAQLGLRAAGFLAMLVGLALLVRGLETAVFPLGEALGDALARPGRFGWLLGFAFAAGFGATAAEPALAAVAAKAAAAIAAEADGVDPAALALRLRWAVAAALGLALAFGVLRILRGWPAAWAALPAYAIVAALALGAEPEAVAVALDAGAAAASLINIPLTLALGIGLSATIRGRNPLSDGFGLVVLASLTPMAVLLAAAAALG